MQKYDPCHEFAILALYYEWQVMTYVLLEL
ncbi:hypothetical protein FIU82_06685 [Pseudoalteromonas sp. THAF3]|nr:hypothetical protein FIU82_06685 [Pseudoalteromonas sp. THAF3]